MDFVMYTCPVCKKLYKINGHNKKAKCSKCVNSYLIDIGIAFEAWPSLDASVKKSLVDNAVSKKQPTVDNNTKPVPQNNTIRNNGTGVAFKCKMCGGQLEVMTDESVCTCDYCGTTQTLPSLSDEKRVSLYDRANHFRRSNEFDKAMGIYEHILSEDQTDAEAYWSIVLCRYGIEYVEDPATKKRKPTVNRTQPVSILNDSDYLSALENADSIQKRVYEEEAKEIDRIQREIISIAHKEQPFDIFISYKETAPNGQRTKSSVLAQDLYEILVEAGYRVFFSRITLEDKIGQQFEPYIYSALSTAKIMLVIGTDKEEFNAPWVKNEWSRFLGMMKSDKEKLFIPCFRDMDAYDMPEEMGIFQCQDMSKVGFEQDLIRGIAKVIGTQRRSIRESKVTEEISNKGNGTAPLLRRAFMSLEDEEWDKADGFCEQVLNVDPENAEAYLGKLLAQLKKKNKGDLFKSTRDLKNNKNYQKALRFGDESLKAELREYPIRSSYNLARYLRNEKNFEEAITIFEKLSDYKDSEFQIKKCIYGIATRCKNKGEYDEAIRNYRRIPGFEDADSKIMECEYDKKYDTACFWMKKEEYDKAIEIFSAIKEYRKSEKKIQECIALKDKAEKEKEEEKVKSIVLKNARDRIEKFGNRIDCTESFITLFGKNYKKTYIKLTSDGTVEIIGNTKNLNKQVKSWKNIVDVYLPSYYFVLGIKSDGTVLSINTVAEDVNDIDLSGWNNIKKLCPCARFRYVIGLSYNGIILVAGKDYFKVDRLTDIEAISAYYDRHLIALRCDGSVFIKWSIDKTVDLDWKNIVAVAASGGFVAGLDKYGKVKVQILDSKRNNRIDCSEWNNIVEISVSGNHIVGLMLDGRVVASGENKFGECDVDSWEDIVKIYTEDDATIGVSSDGKILVAGIKDDEICPTSL